MYNYLMLFGRLAKKPEIVEFPDGKRVVNVTLAVARSFKNTKGEIETDFFNIAFWDFLVDIIFDNAEVGMALGIKGRIQNSVRELPEGKSMIVTNLIGERVFFFGNPGGLVKEEKNEDE